MKKKIFQNTFTVTQLSKMHREIMKDEEKNRRETMITMNTAERKTPDLGIIYPDILSDSFLTDILSELNQANLKLEARKQESSVAYAALEWFIPTAFIVYIFKSYFDSFLKEAGKDHYGILKKWLKDFFIKARHIKIKIIVADGSPGKLQSENNQSKSVSIVVQTTELTRIKFLFDDNLSDAEWDKAIESLFLCLDEHYSSYPSDYLTKELLHLERKPGHEIYAILNPESLQWIFIDQKRLIEMYKKEIMKKSNNQPNN